MTGASWVKTDVAGAQATLSCKESEHKADLASGFEDPDVLKSLGLNRVAYRQRILCVSLSGTQLKITTISSNCHITYVLLKALT